MNNPHLDPRVNAFREDLASINLEGQVKASRFVVGQRYQVMAEAAPLRRTPRFDAALDTEALHGETCMVFEETEGWAWAQLDRDNYVGYIPTERLSRNVSIPTHRVRTLRTFVYPKADIKAPPQTVLSFGAKVCVQEVAGDFVKTGPTDFIYARHLAPIKTVEPDFVAVAELFLNTPYLWGGRQSLGLDCSALVQIALEATGLPCPRDSYMQERDLGKPIAEKNDFSALKRGDLIFWKGHVGIMLDHERLLHANGYHMETIIEPVSIAVKRIATAHGPVTSLKRLTH